MLKPYFEMETGQMFASGLKVLVKVSVEFHELYGLSLTVLDIDPEPAPEGLSWPGRRWQP